MANKLDKRQMASSLPLPDVQKKLAQQFTAKTEQVRFVSRLKQVVNSTQKKTIIFALVFHRQNFGEYGLFLFNELDSSRYVLFDCMPLNQNFHVKMEDLDKGHFSIKYIEQKKLKTYLFEMPTDAMNSTLFIIQKALYSIGRPHVPLHHIYSRLDSSWEEKILPPFQWISVINEKYDLDHQEITYLNPLYQSFWGDEVVVSSIQIIERGKNVEEGTSEVVTTNTKDEEVELSDDEDGEKKLVLSSDDEDIKGEDEEEWN